MDQFLHEKIPGLSRTRIQKAIRERVTLSWDVNARPSTSVRAGGEVRVGYRELNETLLEIFYRIALSPSIDLTPDLQIVFDPAYNEQDDLVFIPGVRLAFRF